MTEPLLQQLQLDDGIEERDATGERLRSPVLFKTRAAQRCRWPSGSMKTAALSHRAALNPAA
jgi:hypothetical protein